MELELEKVVTLQKPVEFAGVTHTELRLREPTAAQMEKAANAKNNIGAVIDMISLVAAVPRQVAEQLCQRDFKECDAFFGQFLG